jgi:hypothetical protein
VVAAGDATLLALGAAQVLYGVLAFAVLIRDSGEFSVGSTAVTA